MSGARNQTKIEEKIGVHCGFLAEVGSTFTFTYTGLFLSSCDAFLWYRQDRAITVCFQDSSVPNATPDYKCVPQPFTRQSDGVLKVENNRLKTNLTITNVSRSLLDSDEGLWILACDTPYTSNVTTFDLKLYTKAKSTVCKTEIEKSGILVTCTCERIFPEAKLYLEVTFNQTKWPNGISSSCQNILDSSKLYYTSTCSHVLAPESLKTGRLDLNMTVYPDLTASLSDLAYGTSFVSSLYFDTPRIALSDCNGGAALTCTCQRSDDSDIPTNVIWLINGTEEITSSNRFAVLKSTVTRYTTNYTCLAVNVLGWPSEPLEYHRSALSETDSRDGDVAAVVGGVVAGVVILSIVTLAVLVIRRRGGCVYLMRGKSNVQSQARQNEDAFETSDKDCAKGKTKGHIHTTEDHRDNNVVSMTTVARGEDINITDQSEHYSRGGEYDVTQPSYKDSRTPMGHYGNVAITTDSDFHEYQEVLFDNTEGHLR